VPPGSTTVEITLDPTATGTRLHLIHRGLSDPMADAHDGGWANYLHRLAVAAAGRDPGPDPLAAERVPSATEQPATTMTPEQLVRAFNDAINQQSLDSLSALMTEDHRFVDPAEAVVDGKAACLDAWRSFFAAFPDYRNHFETIRAVGDEVVVDGYSTCSVPALAGPARWHVLTRSRSIREWRVTDPDDPARCRRRAPMRAT